MKRKIITTGDGSKTIQIEDWNEQYHSIHGAINEANHVFIQNGLDFYLLNHPKNEATIAILEIGFGTALNAFLTALRSTELQSQIQYTGVEAFPISDEEIEALNYTELIEKNQNELYSKLHQVSWEKEHLINNNFTLIKRQQDFLDISDQSQYNIIYFDAFGARVQPELWTETVFQKMYDALKHDGVLVTYAAKGSVRRAMLTVGFEVERLQGPPGKRHMLRAIKSL